jgi:hypothetical protein
METEILALAIAIGGLLIGLLAAGIVAAIVTAAIWHLFPNCAYSRWVKDEIFQEEVLASHIQFKDAQVGDCLNPRRQK